MPSNALVIAHRTCPLHVPENTLAGIVLAGDLGADGVEVDVRRTLDGVLFLHHDRTLWRSARLPLPVWAVPWWLIRRRRPFPTFEEALKAMDPKLFMAIDIKHSWAAGAVLKQVRKLGLERSVKLWAQSPKACALLSREAPDIEVAYLNDARSAAAVEAMLSTAVNVGASAVSAHWATVTREFLSDARSRGLRVYAMAREASAQREKLALGIDAVVTDWPEEAIAARSEVNGVDPVRTND